MRSYGKSALRVALRRAGARPCRRLIIACIGALVASPVAHAAPWDGGADVVTPVELRATTVFTSALSRPVHYVCESPESWMAAFASIGMDGNDVWGVVIRGTNVAYLAPHTCLRAESFLNNPRQIGQKLCQSGTQIQTKLEPRTKYKVVRKRVRGRWVKRRVPVTVMVEVPVQVPVYAACNDYVYTIFALNTFPHEAFHLAGVYDEAVAECASLQNLEWFASQFGADAAFAREIAADYWTLYTAIRPGTEYHHPDCREGGPLDLRPTDTQWPNRASPAGLGEAFGTRAPDG